VNSDYHLEMNAKLFNNWFVNHSVNYLEEGSIIVMANASCHFVIFNNFPSTNSRKSELLTG
jgi:hypothetical protein